jgi:hypothetical protein
MELKYLIVGVYIQAGEKFESNSLSLFYFSSYISQYKPLHSLRLNIQIFFKPQRLREVKRK